MKTLHFKSKEAYGKERKSYKVKHRMNNKGDWGGLMVGILMAFITITMLISMLPGYVDIIGVGQSSDSLNCKGYTDSVTPSLSYNATIGEKSTIGCLAIKLYIPYILLGALVAVVGGIMYAKSGSQQQYAQ